jgi:hypothetical protein
MARYVAQIRVPFYYEIVAASIGEAYELAVEKLKAERGVHSMAELHSVIRIDRVEKNMTPNEPRPPPCPGGAAPPPNAPTPGTPTIDQPVFTEAVAA